MELGEVSIAHAVRLLHVLQRLQALLAILLGFGQIVRICGPPCDASCAIVVGQQRQSADVVGIRLQHAVGGVQRLLRVAGLLIGDHQQLQRVFLHHRVGIGLQEGFQCLRFLRGILLLDGVHVSVVFSRILDFLLLRLRLTGWRRLAAAWATDCWTSAALANTSNIMTSDFFILLAPRFWRTAESAHTHSTGRDKLCPSISAA